MSKTKDLFDDTAMSFGEHLDVLRTHLVRALVGLVLCVIFALFFGDRLVAVVRTPIDRALQKFGQTATDDLEGIGFWESVKSYFGEESQTRQQGKNGTVPSPDDESQQPGNETTIVAKIRATDLARALHRLDPQFYPKPTENDERTLSLPLSAPAFAEFRQTTANQKRPVTLNVQEAFMTYLKVSAVAGLLIASPWVFYQLWLFVAAGLYPHERKYVYTYLPMSVVLFFSGAIFCFLVVFPFVLTFLLGFNKMLEFLPQIRISEWINFAVILPLMFGVSFQLPLVMLFLERISIFEAKDYREKRRLAILVIAILSMLLTPSDPGSMIAMMVPLLVLYEMGILMCSYSPSKKNPFEAES